MRCRNTAISCLFSLLVPRKVPSGLPWVIPVEASQRISVAAKLPFFTSLNLA